MKKERNWFVKKLDDFVHGEITYSVILNLLIRLYFYTIISMYNKKEQHYGSTC